jgi:YbbR domain-containing protein
MASRNIILHNFGWKMLSLLLAALMWLYIATVSQRDERIAAASREVVTENRRPFYGIPITLLNSTANTNQYAVTPQMVSVEVEGEDRKALDDLQARRVQAFVDVTDAEDEKQFRRPIQVSVPKAFTVFGIAPSNAIVERITSPR